MKINNTEQIRKVLLEATAIAIGVFTALLVDNWNEERKDQQLAQQFLEGIALDLNLNSERIVETKTLATKHKGSLERVIHAVRSGENTWTSPESFVLDLVQCTYLGTPTLSSVAFDELQSTGSMRLLKDAEFKRELYSYYAAFESNSQFHAEYRRKEAAVEEALLGFLPLSDRIQISDDYLGLKNSAVNVTETLKQLQEIPNLLPRLEDMVWVQHRIITRYDDVIVFGNELLANMESLN